jgi:uncharacterized membrane protein
LFKQSIENSYLETFTLRDFHNAKGEKNMKALDAAMIGICAALYAVVGRLTDFGVTVGGVAFWPAAVIPAVFAVLFGPWTAATGSAIGIFIRDMFFHGDPLLSLSAGVTSNFVGFLIIGYVSRTNLSWKKISTSAIIGSAVIAIGLLLPTFLLPTETGIFTGLSSLDSALLFIATVVISILVMMVVARTWHEWRNYAVGSVIGVGVGSSIIAIVIWVYSQVFFSTQGYFKAPVPSSFIPVIFVWTFATEIPFVLLLGPPIIKALCKAYPSLKVSQKTETREK